MSEMVERVAAAIRIEGNRWMMERDLGGYVARRFKIPSDDTTAPPMQNTSLGLDGERARGTYSMLVAKACATAAIAAMREPSEAILEPGGCSDSSREDTLDLWRRQIDAALTG